MKDTVTMEAAKTQFLTADGGTLAYDDQGSGPLVVCVPGIGDLRAQYRFLTPILRDAGYRVVTLDLRGHGESSTSWNTYGVNAVGNDIIALLRHLDSGPAFLIGNSLAAGAAVCAAADRPDLVAGMVLIGPFVRDVMPLWLSRPLFTSLTARPWGPAFWRRYYRSLYPSRVPADFDAYLARQSAMLAEPGRFTALRRLMTGSKAASERRLEQVKTPALVVMGTRDPDFPKPAAEAQRVAERLHGDVFPASGAGHYPHAEFPEIVGPKIVSFLNDLRH